MGRERKTILAIDLGSSQVRVLAGRVTDSGEIDVLALGASPALGMQRGIAVNVDDASYAVKTALDHARLDGRLRALEVYAGMGGKHLSSLNSLGEASTSRGDGLVSSKDVSRALEISRGVELPEESYLLHAIPRSYRVDGYRCRRTPIGMHGAVVQAESHLVTASGTPTKNLLKAIEMAGKEVDGLVASGIAASQAVLRQEETEMGVVLLDIGGGCTDIVAYSEGALFHTSAMPLGGNQIASDIAIALNTSLPVAEETLQQHGACISDEIDPGEELTITCFGAVGHRRVRRHYLNEIIRLRLTEMLRLAFYQAKRAAPEVPTPAGVVITGGVANLPDIEKVAEQVLQAPARVGYPAGAEDPSGSLRNPSYAAAVGILQLTSDASFDVLKTRRNGQHRPFRLLAPFSGLRV